MKLELYTTFVEQEAYDLGGQLALAQVRSHVEPRRSGARKDFWVVVIDSPEAQNRAVKIRDKMFKAVQS